MVYIHQSKMSTPQQRAYLATRFLTPLYRELSAILRLARGEEVPDEDRAEQMGVTPKIWASLQSLAAVVVAIRAQCARLLAEKDAQCARLLAEKDAQCAQQLAEKNGEIKGLKDALRLALGKEAATSVAHQISSPVPLSSSPGPPMIDDEMPLIADDPPWQWQEQEQEQEQEQAQAQGQAQEVPFVADVLNAEEMAVLKILASICGRRQGNDVVFEAAPNATRAMRARYASSMIKFLANPSQSAKKKRLASMVYAIGHVGAGVTTFGVRPERHWCDVKAELMRPFFFWMRTGRASADQGHPVMRELWLLFVRMVKTLADQTPDVFDVGSTLDLAAVVYRSLNPTQRSHVISTSSTVTSVIIGDLPTPLLSETVVRADIEPTQGRQIMRLVSAPNDILLETAMSREGPNVISAVVTTTMLANDEAEIDAARTNLVNAGIC